jgi:hypothetical protein
MLLLIVMVTIVVEALLFLRVYRLPFVQVTFLGATHSLIHWIGWGGTLYIFFAALVQPIVKLKAVSHLRSSLNLHMIGNLLGVLLISIHFAQQVTRPAANYPILSTGIVLYPTMVMLAATGIITYSSIMARYAKSLRFLHAAFAVTFYIVIIVHILHGVSMI